MPRDDQIRDELPTPGQYRPASIYVDQPDECLLTGYRTILRREPVSVNSPSFIVSKVSPSHCFGPLGPGL